MAANGMTRIALSKMKLEGNKDGTKEMSTEMDVLSNEIKGSVPKKMKKISLKNPSEHNHSA